jgi:1,4-dihydroxy-6-naphthoate synthase
MNQRLLPLIRFGHSPDADDAFMFYGLAKKIIAIPGYQVEHIMQDIQSLNQRAINLSDLEVTAISAAAYPYLAHNYRIMSTGASISRNYGPILVSKSLNMTSQLSNCRIAIPGEYTTAFLLLRMYLGKDLEKVKFYPMHFDHIMQAVLEEKVEAGLIIHEGQLIYQELGLQKVCDMGEWWGQETGLPIPLGLDVVRKDLGEELMIEINRGLRRSIESAFKSEELALDYALSFSRGLDRETCRQFIHMYVNSDTLDMGSEGQRSLETLFIKAYQAGLLDTVPHLNIISN